jgi:hypothetical protein
VIELRLHTVAYSEIDANGFIGIQFDAFGEEKSGLPTSETHHPHGFRSRNRDPEGEFGSNVLVGWEGEETHALLVLADPRWIKSLPPEKKGGSTQYGVTKNGAKAVSFSQFDGDTGGYTLYVPEFGGSDVTGAYVITVDPTQRTIQLIHPEGFAVMITKDGIIQRGDDSTYSKMGKGVFEVVAAKIMMRGVCYLGANAEAGIPLLPALATQPTPSVFFSPT